MSRKLWTDEEKEQLRRLYSDRPTHELATMLSRSLSKIYAQAKKLGLKKSKAYLASAAACRLRREEHPCQATQFKPGHVPANKGLRRPGWAVGRMKETQFKKGTRMGAANNNWKPVGTICPNADGYLRIKVADEPESIAGKGASSTNWEFVHKRVWEAAHGPIPKGHRMWWKDGNHMNCALDNLELLTDKQHMARTTIHNLPPELKTVIQLSGALKRVIRRKMKSHGEEPAGGFAESSIRDVGESEGRREADGGRASAGRR